MFSIVSLLAACAEAYDPSQAANPGSSDTSVDAAVAPSAAAAFRPDSHLPAMSAAMKQRVFQAASHASSDLVLERRADGISRVRLRRRFQGVSIVTRDDAGRAQRRCVDDPIALEALLGAESP